MKFKQFNKLKFFILILLCAIITMAVFAPYSNETMNDSSSPTIMNSQDRDKPKLADSFELIQDFQASTYFISPTSSLGENDEVYFSFMGNKDGNFTIQIENHPSYLTYSLPAEQYVSFDNPSGTDLWYLGYYTISVDMINFGLVEFKMLESEDKGKTWNEHLIYNVTGEVTDISQLNTYVTGTAIAVNPDTGFMILVTWINQTDLTFFRSFDNGTTWSSPINIFNSTEMGAENRFSSSHPRIDVAIMQNGSILIVSEADDAKFTDLVFVQSRDNNGTDWAAPKNVTCSAETDGQASTAKIPKIQVDRSSDKYWLMWKDFISGEGNNQNETQRWAQFELDQNLFADVPYQNISNYDCPGSYDFYFDHTNDKFRFISLKDVSELDDDVIIENWTCSDYDTNSWTITVMGQFSDLGYIFHRNYYMNYVYSDEKNNLFYADFLLGNVDVYHYIVLQDVVFGKYESDFFKDELRQIKWRGRKMDGSLVETSLVKVKFWENYTDYDVEDPKSFFIFIDNENPSIKDYQQKRNYFNPLSSNITLTEIPWEIRPSESCEAYLEIYSEKASSNSWNQISENNWEDIDPDIFYSESGILYVVYKSYESGRQIVYLIKSYDMGVTWEEPVSIFDSTEDITCNGVAKGDLVFIYVSINHLDIYYEHLLFRSFDQGVTFQDPLNIDDNAVLFTADTESVSSMVITKNGTLFMTYRNGNIAPITFNVIRSSDLGVNWVISNIFPGNDTLYPMAEPILGYEPIYDLVYFARLMGKIEADLTSTVNISLAGLIVKTNQWSAEGSTLIQGGRWTGDLNFIITRDNNTVNPEIHLTFLYDADYSTMIFEYREFVSYDLGVSWTEDKKTDLDVFHSTCTNLKEIFFIKAQTDGNDRELHIKRIGKLVRTDQSILTPSFSTDFSFDGINDFGDYIEEGNYTYIMRLKDNAGNTVKTEGWLYADYNAPQITDFSTDRGAPIPRFGLTISANITDGINFTAYLYYQKDNGAWQRVTMKNVSRDYFSATIPGDISTNKVEYYIKAVDLAGNEYNLDNNGNYYSYGMPSFVWSSEGLFKETKEYSSSNSYTFEITISDDLEYVKNVFFRYSYDEGDSWEDLELEQSSPEFSGELDDIPGDLRTLYYEIIIVDIYGNEYILADTQKIDFYPEVPSPETDGVGIAFLIVISGAIGFMIAFGYIRLKKVSHEMIYQKILSREFAKQTVKPEKLERKSIRKKKEPDKKTDSIIDIETIDKYKIASAFTMTYQGVLCGTIFLFLFGIFMAIVEPSLGMLILAGSLLLGVYGYMILMSRDITINIYTEKIHTGNILLESFQMIFLFINIITILLVGYSIDWFRYYLVESTFDIGDLSIPRLYLSVIAVFFTSLVLVIITTYFQLRKTVSNISNQRAQGANENLLLYSKDQNSSRLITHTGYKTIVFVVTVLLTIFSTTNLLNNETGVLLAIILVPFVIASFSALIIDRLIEREKMKKEKEQMQLLFVDSKKKCIKCGEEIYLSNKYCGLCGDQQIFSDMMGTYVSRCAECNTPIYDKVKFCTDCGKRVSKQRKKL